MTSILIVKHDKGLAEYLSLSFGETRPDWTQHFSCSAKEAMSALQNSDFDVVIADMPGREALHLLRDIRIKHPKVSRILVSDLSEKEEALKMIGEAHQFLTKPMKPEELIIAVDQATSSNRFLTNKSLRKAVAELSAVPSMPVVYSELLVEVNKSDPSIKQIASIVRRDIGMTAKILQISNSAFLGLQREIKDSSEAVRILGVDTIVSLTLAIGVFTQFQTEQANSDLIKQIWNHSTSVARIAKKISREERPQVASDAFTAGLLHDIGEVVMAASHPHEFAQTRDFSPLELDSSLEAEREMFGATHSEIGAYLLSLWGIPDSIVETVEFHHNPSKQESSEFSALTAVHFADAFIEIPKIEEEFQLEQLCDMEHIRSIGAEEKIKTWFEACSEQSDVPG